MDSNPLDSFLQAIKDSLVRMCGPSRYKNGAFTTKAVTKNSPVLDDLKTIIGSPLLSQHEKNVFEEVKKSFINSRNMQAHGETRIEKILPELKRVMALEE